MSFVGEGKEAEGKGCKVEEGSKVVKGWGSTEAGREAGIHRGLWGRQGSKVLRVASKCLHRLGQSHTCASRTGNSLEANLS